MYFVIVYSRGCQKTVNQRRAAWPWIRGDLCPWITAAHTASIWGPSFYRHRYINIMYGKNMNNFVSGACNDSQNSLDQVSDNRWTMQPFADQIPDIRCSNSNWTAWEKDQLNILFFIIVLFNILMCFACFWVIDSELLAELFNLRDLCVKAWMTFWLRHLLILCLYFYPFK